MVCLRQIKAHAAKSAGYTGTGGNSKINIPVMKDSAMNVMNNHVKIKDFNICVLL